MIGRETDPCIGPGGLRVVLVHERHPLRPCAQHGLELQGGIAADLFGQGPIQRIRDIGFPAFQHGQPGRGLGHALEHEPFGQRRLAPVGRMGF